MNCVYHCTLYDLVYAITDRTTATYKETEREEREKKEEKSCA